MLMHMCATQLYGITVKLHFYIRRMCWYLKREVYKC